VGGACVAGFTGNGFNQFTHPHQRFEHPLDSRRLCAEPVGDIIQAKACRLRLENGQDFGQHLNTVPQNNFYVPYRRSRVAKEASNLENQDRQQPGDASLPDCGEDRPFQAKFSSDSPQCGDAWHIQQHENQESQRR
jgi:hypothetical protein